MIPRMKVQKEASAHQRRGKLIVIAGRHMQSTGERRVDAF